MRYPSIKYLLPYTVIPLAFLSFASGGLWSYSIPVYTFVLIPIIDVVLPKDTYNFNEEEKKSANSNMLYSYILYGLVPLQYIFLFLFLEGVTNPECTIFEIIGMTLGMGIISGNLVNLAHELGHRKNRFKQFLAKVSLMQILMMDFFIYHNNVHHKWVATEKDPASAKKGDNFYVFLFKDIFGSASAAWNVEARRLYRKGHSSFSWANQVLQYYLCEFIFLALVTWLFAWQGLVFTLICSFFAHFVLSQLNFIQHYGLRRKLKENGNYERPNLGHSWNSPSFWSSAMLFTLPRHSDHHFKSSIPYQTLTQYEDSPHHPYGYPTMMILCLIPPLWYKIMDPILEKRAALT